MLITSSLRKQYEFWGLLSNIIGVRLYILKSSETPYAPALTFWNSKSFYAITFAEQIPRAIQLDKKLILTDHVTIVPSTKISWESFTLRKIRTNQNNLFLFRRN